MKEKRIDIYLAKAGFYQLLFIGSVGTFFTELIDDESRGMVLWGSLLTSVVFVMLIFRYYRKANSLSKKHKE